MNKIVKILIGAGVIVIAYIGYQYIKKPASSTTNVSTSVGGIVAENFDAGNAGDNQEFLRVLKNLQNVSLDGSILSSSAFTSLVDFGIELTPQPQGRPNPFIPINPNEQFVPLSPSPVSSASTTKN